MSISVTILSGMPTGGISDYSHHQANALADLGVDVALVCTPKFLEQRSARYSAVPILSDIDTRSSSRVLRRLVRANDLVSGTGKFCRFLQSKQPHHVLTHFSEYLAPLWVPSLNRLRRRGFQFHTVLHDPVRDFQVGPAVVHRASVRMAMELNTTIFVHGDDRGDAPRSIPVLHVPHGIFAAAEPTESRDAVRRKLGVPADSLLLIAFGYIRDNKNLDLVLRAVADTAKAFLVVAGTDILGGNRTAPFYQELAKTLGCEDRVVFLNRFIPNDEAANLLVASDVLMLTYSASFVSSSGVLGLGAAYRLPCIISSGSQSTRETVERYGIGVWVGPDSVDAIREGLRRMATARPLADWDGYHRDNSWARNAEIILDRIRSLEAGETGSPSIGKA